MATREEINADMLAFWNGKGGETWVARQQHTDITLAPVTDALLAFSAPRAGERVVDIGCGCGGAPVSGRDELSLRRHRSRTAVAARSFVERATSSIV